MGPRPSFQYRRASSRLGLSRPSQATNLTPAPLQNIINRSNVPQSIPQNSPYPTKRLSIAEPVSKKKPRQKKSRSSLHKRIQTGIPEERRLKMLVEAVMLDEYETRYADVSTAEREQFEEGMLKASDFLEKLATELQEGDESVAGKRRPNPMNRELEERAVKLQEIINSYRLELEKWDSVEAESAKPVEVATLPDGPDAEQLAQLPDPTELAKSSAEAIETYILQADHLRNLLRKLESRNRETHSRVQTIAAALNDRVISEFGKKSEGGLTPPANLASVKVTGIDM